MSESRLESKVGLFVLLGVVLIAALLLSFSKGAGLGAQTYELRMRATSVGGLKARSAVLLSGVEVGKVEAIELIDGGRAVIVRLKIRKKYPIYGDAQFVIQQIGVLGDQFVAVVPGKNEAPLLKEGDEVKGRDPFNLQEVARSTGDLIKRFETLAASVTEAINRVNSQVLDARTLSNFSQTIGNFRTVSEHTLTVVDNFGSLVASNGPSLSTAVSNVVSFTARLEQVVADLDDTILTNRAEITTAVKNLAAGTASLKQLAADLDSGKGLVGSLLKDEALKQQLGQTVNNLALLSSNLNKYGLLYKPKPPKDPALVQPHSGKSPF